MNDKCPNCGYCPHCGRSAQPIGVMPYRPWPVWPTPWWQVPYDVQPYWGVSQIITICGDGAATTGSTVQFDPNQPFTYTNTLGVATGPADS